MISLVIPFAAYLPADASACRASWRRSPPAWSSAAGWARSSRPTAAVLWLSTWKMIGFVLNGFVFVLIGLELPDVLDGPGGPRRRRSSSGCRGR